MKVSKIVFLIILLALLALSCDRVSSIHGSVAGTVYRDGRPQMGQIQVIDPKTGNSIITEPVSNAGHFIIPGVPPGEWLLGFLGGPSASPLGEMMYVRVQPGRPVTNLEFEILDADPKVEELLQKIQQEREAPPTE